MSRIREIVRRWLNGTKKENDVEVQMVHNNVGKPSTELMQPVPKQYKLCVKTTIAELASSGQTYWKFTQSRSGRSQENVFAEYKKEAEARIRETMQAEGVICSQAEVEIEKDEKSIEIQRFV